MPKTSSQNLYDLIHSLTKNEKGYFKKYSSKHTSSNNNVYIELFDLINKQKKYDETEIIVQLGERAKHLSAAKNYLTKTIIESLKAFHSEDSPQTIINGYTHTSRLLLSKGLKKQYNTYLEKAKSIAIKHEYFYEAIIINMEQIYQARSGNKTSAKELDVLTEEKNHLNRLIENRTIYSDHYTAMYREYLRPGDISKSFKEKANQILNSKDFENINNALSFSAKVDFLETKTICYYAKSNREIDIELNIEKVNLFKENKEFLKETKWKRYYFVQLANLANRQCELKAYEDMKGNLDEIEKLASNNDHLDRHLKARIFEAHASMTLQYLFRTGNFEGIHAYIGSISDELSHHERHLNDFNVVRLSFFCILALFADGDNEACLNWFVKISNKIMAHRKNLDVIQKTLQIIIHIELGNYSLAESLLRSSKRQIRDLFQESKSVNIIWQYLGKKLSGKYKMNAAYYNSLIHELKELPDKELDRDILNNTLIIPYLKSKVNKSAFKQELYKYFN